MLTNRKGDEFFFFFFRLVLSILVPHKHSPLLPLPGTQFPHPQTTDLNSSRSFILRQKYEGSKRPINS